MTAQNTGCVKSTRRWGQLERGLWAVAWTLASPLSEAEAMEGCEQRRDGI